MPHFHLLARSAAFMGAIVTGVQYRWYRLLSAISANRCAEVGGHVFLGSGTRILGHKYIHIKGRLIAMERNRIEVIESHGGAKFSPILFFGDNVTMENDCHIAVVNRVEIHDSVLMASHVYISDHSHGNLTAADLNLPPNSRPIFSKGPVIIEAEVWLGEGVSVLPGVRIGRSSIIGANSVVTKDVPPRSIAAGSPARVIRTFD